jgi:hypothetical protein
MDNNVLNIPSESDIGLHFALLPQTTSAFNNYHIPGEGKVVTVLIKAPRHEGVWKYTSINVLPMH